VSHGGCAIAAPTVFGAMHGMETLMQLVDRAARTVPAVRVADAPRFKVDIRASILRHIFYDYGRSR